MRSDRRLVVLVFGIVLMAVALFWPSQKPIDPVPQIAQPPVLQDRELVLVAARALDAGSVLSSEKAEWVLASDKSNLMGALRRLEKTDSVNPYLGRLIIQTVAKGDPLLPQHFATLDASNYLAQQISPGKRAYAIAIDTKGTATAGNFILPNDRVDIIKSSNSNMGLQSETILTHIRVLAIGQNVHGEGLSSSGDTATVEVDLSEAEILATAQRTGQISLALRNPTEGREGDVRANSISIIRPSAFGEKAP